MIQLVQESLTHCTRACYILPNRIRAFVGTMSMMHFPISTILIRVGGLEMEELKTATKSDQPIFVRIVIFLVKFVIYCLSFSTMRKIQFL